MAEPTKVAPLSKAGPAAGGKLLPIETEMLARATGQKPFVGPDTWFGPGQPLQPQAPETVKAGPWTTPSPSTRTRAPAKRPARTPSTSRPSAASATPPRAAWTSSGLPSKR